MIIEIFKDDIKIEDMIVITENLTIKVDGVDVTINSKTSPNSDFKQRAKAKSCLKQDIKILKNSFDKSRVYSKEDIESEIDEFFGKTS